MAWSLIALAFILSLGVNLFVIRRAHSKGALAKVNKRSNHKIPTPLGGGFGILTGYLVTSLAWNIYLYSAHNYSVVMPIGIFLAPFIKGLLPVLVLAGVSWWNDSHDMSAIKRLCIQFACVALGLSAMYGEMPFMLWVLFVFGWVWFINLYNFMDGINGILAIETLSILLGVAGVMWITGNMNSSMLMLALLGAAVLAFLYLNFPNARMFAGDVGSIPLGFIIGSLCIQLGFKTNFISALILPLYFIADATLLLFQRLMRREKVWEAHSGHYYQQAVRKGWSHARVTLTVGALNLVLIGLSTLAAQYEMMQFPALGMALLAVGACLWHFKRPDA